MERELVFRGAVAVDPDVSTTAAHMVLLAFEIDAFLHECYYLPRIWTFLQRFCSGLEHILYSQYIF